MLSLRAVTGRRHRSVARVVVAAVAGLLVVGGLTSASADPRSGPLTPAAGTGLAVPAAASQLPHPGLPPISGAGRDGGALLNGTASVAKAKTTITLPLQLQRVYAQDSFEYLPKGCDPGVPGQCSQLNAFSPVWAITNPGPDPSFGVLPDTRVTVLGFGALPVSATLHLSQLVSGGQVQPLQVTTFGFTTSVKNTTAVTGQLRVRLSDVTVDGVALDVGPDCTTVSPATLDLKGAFSGFGPIDPLVGLPTVKKGEYNVFFGGRVSGDVTIPAFTGCGTASQDLDPLFTGTVSGGGNTLTLNQSFLGSYDTTQPQDCAITSTKGVIPCPEPAMVPLPKK